MKIAHPEAAFREAAEEACRSIGAMVETYVYPSSRTVLGRGLRVCAPGGLCAGLARWRGMRHGVGV